MLLANLVIMFLVSIPPLKTTRPKKYYLWDMSEGRMNKNRAVMMSVVAMAICYRFKLRTEGVASYKFYFFNSFYTAKSITFFRYHSSLEAP